MPIHGIPFTTMDVLVAQREFTALQGLAPTRCLIALDVGCTMSRHAHFFVSEDGCVGNYLGMRWYESPDVPPGTFLLAKEIGA